MDILKLLELIKDLPIKKIFILSIVGSFMLGIMKLEVVLPYVQEHFMHKPIEPPKVVRSNVLSSVDLDVAPDDLLIIKQYTDKYSSQLGADLYSASVYKFIPEGESYMYQGRVLAYLNASDEMTGQYLAKEMNVSWIPLWSGKPIVEEIMSNKTIEVFFSQDQYKYHWQPSGASTKAEFIIHSVNLDLLKEIPIVYMYYQPIQRNGNVVGYIALYFKKEPNKQQVKEIASTLSARLLPYILGEAK